jgi:two-component system chemotaxis response regulator CheB
MNFHSYFRNHDYRAVVIGGSAGSIRVVCDILKKLKPDFPLPILMALHRAPQKESGMIKVFESQTRMPIIEPSERMLIKPGHVYLAPSDKHLFVEPDLHVNTDQSELVQYSRPSIDVLLYSAAEIYQDTLLGILLTGANRDGAMGMKHIHDMGGHTVVQDPEEAVVDFMPKSVMELIEVNHVLKASQIAELLNVL